MRDHYLPKDLVPYLETQLEIVALCGTEHFILLRAPPPPRPPRLIGPEHLERPMSVNLSALPTRL